MAGDCPVEIGLLRPEVGVLLLVCLDPGPCLAQAAEEVGDLRAPGLDGSSVGGDAGQPRHQVAGGENRPCAGNHDLLRDIRLPHRKGIDAAARQGGGGVDRHQLDELHVVLRQAGFLQRAQGQLLAPGTGPVGDFPALEIGNAAHRRILRHQQGYGIGVLPRDADQLHRRTLGGEEDEARVAEETQVQRSGLQPFGHRRGGLEMLPFDLVRRAFENSRGLHGSPHVVVVLVAHTQRRQLCGLGQGGTEQKRGEAG